MSPIDAKWSEITKAAPFAIRNRARIIMNDAGKMWKNEYIQKVAAARMSIMPSILTIIRPHQESNLDTRKGLDFKSSAIPLCDVG